MGVRNPVGAAAGCDFLILLLSNLQNRQKIAGCANSCADPVHP
ncbi:hypothetical protein PS691_00201 [Pseudomonas fluorescens]|uniref:Uncharacterized protein n=1 Tax=Pseudomonas fluorescens TaxID=294 RepID=A0A5E6ZMH4_PSEFL|nr:hypothetical protein PS691_00201 [Pseudomonas fluorescens]